jgi:hypothetical protein
MRSQNSETGSQQERARPRRASLSGFWLLASGFCAQRASAERRA